MNLKLLYELFSQPTAPFLEMHVARVVQKTLQTADIPYWIDPVGNIVVGVHSEESYRRLIQTPSREPLRVLIAHMDHPGFHATKWISPKKLAVKYHGGGPTKHLNGTPVRICSTQNGILGTGILRQTQLVASRRTIDCGVVELKSEELHHTHRDPKNLFCTFQFRAPVFTQGKLLYTVAVDDVVNVHSIVATALALKKRRQKSPWVGLLTRGEEVGYVGCIGHFKRGYFTQAQRPILGVSLEASRTLPGAEIGKGPIVRLGDRASVFTNDPIQTLTHVAKKTLGGRFQRRIMDGGTCEGTVVTAYGFPCIALSVPLGNYHNQSLEGGPDSRGPNGPAPEFIHLDDLKGLTRLCLALLQPGLSWMTGGRTRLADFERSLRKYAPLLQRQIH